MRTIRGRKRHIQQTFDYVCHDLRLVSGRSAKTLPEMPLLVDPNVELTTSTSEDAHFYPIHFRFRAARNA
jgi:hypothetical protein